MFKVTFRIRLTHPQSHFRLLRHTDSLPLFLFHSPCPVSVCLSVSRETFLLLAALYPALPFSMSLSLCLSLFVFFFFNISLSPRRAFSPLSSRFRESDPSRFSTECQIWKWGKWCGNVLIGISENNVKMSASFPVQEMMYHFVSSSLVCKVFSTLHDSTVCIMASCWWNQLAHQNFKFKSSILPNKTSAEMFFHVGKMCHRNHGDKSLKKYFPTCTWTADLCLICPHRTGSQKLHPVWAAFFPPIKKLIRSVWQDFNYKVMQHLFILTVYYDTNAVALKSVCVDFHQLK